MLKRLLLGIKDRKQRPRIQKTLKRSATNLAILKFSIQHIDLFFILEGKRFVKSELHHELS